MFSIGDTVIYGTQGVCTIKDITKMKFGKEIHEYYVLTSVNDKKSTAYIPVDNEKLVNKMQNILTPNEIDELIDTTIGDNTDWIENDSNRKVYCDNTIKSGDRKEMISLIRMLYLHQKKLREIKKHLHTVDEKFLREAEKLLNDEFAFSLGISAAEVPEYIKNRVK